MKPYGDDPNASSRRQQRMWILLGIGTFCVIYGMAFALLAQVFLVPMAAPLAILGLLVIWALPDIQNVPVDAIEWFLFALFISLIMWPNYLAIAFPGMPWITLIRLTGFPLTFLLLISVSMSAAFRKHMAAVLRSAPAIWRLIVTFVVIELTSIIFSNQKGVSIDKFIVAQISWTAVFFGSVYVFSKPGRAERWTRYMWAMALAVSIIAIWENRLGHVPWAGHVPSVLKIADPVVAAIMAGQSRAYTGVYRSQATFSTSLGLGEYLALSTPFVLHYIVNAKLWKTRIVSIITLPLMFFAVYLSNARSGALGMLISGMLYVFYWALVRWRDYKRDIIAPGILLAYPAFGVSVFAATMFIGKLHKMVWGGGETESSTDARREQYQTGIPLIWKHPWGYGMGLGAETLNFHEPGGLLTIDTYYLSVALEYGILGFIIYYGTIGLSIFYAFRATYLLKKPEPDAILLAPTAISLTAFLVIKSVFSQQDNHPLVFMMFGLIVGVIFRNLETLNREKHRTRTKASSARNH